MGVKEITEQVKQEEKKQQPQAQQQEKEKGGEENKQSVVVPKKKKRKVVPKKTNNINANNINEILRLFNSGKIDEFFKKWKTEEKSSKKNVLDVVFSNLSKDEEFKCYYERKNKKEKNKIKLVNGFLREYANDRYVGEAFRTKLEAAGISVDKLSKNEGTLTLEKWKALAIYMGKLVPEVQPKKQQQQQPPPQPKKQEQQPQQQQQREGVPLF